MSRNTLATYIDVDYSSSGNIMINKFNQLLEIKFCNSLLAMLRLETPDFIRPLLNHSFKPEEVVILDKEDRWFERGVREVIWVRVEQPALNKKGGLRFQLSHAWDEAIRRLPHRLSRDQSEA